ncbi:hypothetical protein M011DRAFT_486653 [Sporormia fimetaria CBS 119925]|uniref:DUF7704 domain-containing protein n=1 Tax=Sporormia fimetaria CBS 119925 TaxID=1340428 RepID=A0A6A6VA21_9PLEO|nr:hypothetical protein M011DRAFT_486653 [Sporormia fimetaria CBS 119925]
MALGSNLPFWPALIFTYLEPLSYILGWNQAFNTPTEFILTQTPSTLSSKVTPVHPNAILVSYAFANVLLVMTGLVILCTVVTREARVTKTFLFILGCGDLGHLWGWYRGLGADVFWDYNAYNLSLWANIAFTVFLVVNRAATLLGLFGRIGRRA